MGHINVIYLRHTPLHISGTGVTNGYVWSTCVQYYLFKDSRMVAVLVFLYQSPGIKLQRKGSEVERWRRRFVSCFLLPNHRCGRSRQSLAKSSWDELGCMNGRYLPLVRFSLVKCTGSLSYWWLQIVYIMLLLVSLLLISVGVNANSSQSSIKDGWLKLC